MTREAERKTMVETQLKPRGIKDRQILKAFMDVPRHEFVPDKYKDVAYEDHPLPVGEGQTISQPFIVAEMTKLLGVEKGDKVLEIGTGSGYQAAILASMGVEIYTVERNHSLAEKSSEILKKLGYIDIHIKEGDGTLGWPENAPYKGIIVTAASPKAPEPLIDQLDEDGRLVIPVGSRLSQILKVYHKVEGKIAESSHGGCMFVPLIGKYGF